MTILDRLTYVRGTDPDDVRRRQLLNILLVGVGVLALLALIGLTVFRKVDPVSAQQYRNPYPALVLVLAGVAVSYGLNHVGSGILAGTVFCLSLAVAMSIADSPENVVMGGFTFVFVIPIMISSAVLGSVASFVMATFTAVLLAGLALSAGLVPNVVFTLSFYAVALVSWLSARSLESALQEVRELNMELDQRVQDRTRELAEVNEQLREHNRLQMRFFSMVSHELRTPLGIIQGFVEMLSVGVYGEISEKQQEATSTIMSAIHRMSRLTNDLLDQARLAAGLLPLSLAPVSLATLVREMSTEMSVLTESKGLGLVVELATDLPERVIGDQTRLNQILVNLIGNAIKYTERGEVTVRIRREDENHWAMIVADTGRGIPPEAQDYVFDPFRQVEGQSNREVVGSGLGLSIVAHLVELMEGQVQLESEVGRGSTFSVTLPLIPVEEI